MEPLVLLIDDSELIVQMLEMVCAQAGLRTTSCLHFGDVHDAIGAESPQIVITDLNMPDVPGGDTVAALRQIEALGATPIVIVSGRPIAELEREAQARGADGAISKDEGLPGMMQQLPALISQLLG